MRVWERIREAHEKDDPVAGTLVKKIKGGVVVDLMGVDAFLPGSQIALRRVPNIDELLGQAFEFKIIKLNKRRRNIVVSRRVLLEAERKTKRDVLMKELQVGQVRKGVVKNITDFGAFIDLGGVDGLLHITDMSYGRVSHPSELVHIGQELEVKVLDIDWERERISLGLKQLQTYPWHDVAQRYPVGTRVQGKVVSITNYGAFVELEPGIEGLVHISEMSWTRNVRHLVGEARAAPLGSRQEGGRGRGAGPQRGRREQADLPGAEAGAGRPVAAHRRNVPGGDGAARPRAAADGQGRGGGHRQRHRGLRADVAAGDPRHPQSGRRGEGRAGGRAEGVGGGSDTPSDRAGGDRIPTRRSARPRPRACGQPTVRRTGAQTPRGEQQQVARGTPSLATCRFGPLSVSAPVRLTVRLPICW